MTRQMTEDYNSDTYKPLQTESRPPLRQYKPEYPFNRVSALVDDAVSTGTYAVCLNHVYIAVCVIIHLLVDTTDSLVAEKGVLILA